MRGLESVVEGKPTLHYLKLGILAVMSGLLVLSGAKGRPLPSERKLD